MKKGIEHDRMRFRTMTQNQLYTRLGRIKDQDKLDRFVKLADEYGYRALKDAAVLKMRGKLPFTAEDLPKVKYTQPETKVILAKKRRRGSISTSPQPAKSGFPSPLQPLKRYLDF